MTGTRHEPAGEDDGATINALAELVPEKESYRVGPGRPPKRSQFKPGQSGNPSGAKKKPKSVILDARKILQSALDAQVKVTEGGKEGTISKFALAVEQVVNRAAAKGDAKALREIINLAATLGVDLLGRSDANTSGGPGPIRGEDRDALDAFVRRCGGKLDAIHSRANGRGFPTNAEIVAAGKAEIEE